MSIHNRFFLSDFVSIQRNSFLQFLEKGLIEEISKRNPITNQSNTIELFFYSEYYQLAAPKYTPRQAIIKGKSYSSKLYIPVQLTDKKARVMKIKWVYLCDLPIMTKRGHFLINGAARIIVNQIIRSPGVYYQSKIYSSDGEQNSSDSNSPLLTVQALPSGAEERLPPTSGRTFVRHYADLICQRGTWLRLEIDKNKKIWAQTKKGPKMPIMWLLLAMGLTEKMILKSVLEPGRLIYNMLDFEELNADIQKSDGATKTLANLLPPSLSPPDLKRKNTYNHLLQNSLTSLTAEGLVMSQQNFEKDPSLKKLGSNKTKQLPKYVKTPPEAWEEIYLLFTKQKEKAISKTTNTENSPEISPKTQKKTTGLRKAQTATRSRAQIKGSGQQLFSLVTTAGSSQQGQLSELGRLLIFNKFMNPRTYDLSKHGRLNFNKKFHLNISQYQTTLTPQDLLAATNYLLKVEYGLKKVDDIDNLKNRRVRTSGELIQIQFGTGLVRLEKSIKEKMALRGVRTSQKTFTNHTRRVLEDAPFKNQKAFLAKSQNSRESIVNVNHKEHGALGSLFTISTLIPNTKPVNSALREFFGTSPLSQFMDQMNPLAEITHKRRLSSMGPGGVTRDSATLEIRGIHPSHYGRICPVETPEGKNTGLVNSLTTYARVNSNGYIETPFYRVYKGQVQKKTGMYFFSADKEEKIKLGAADLYASEIGFLSTLPIPVRIESDFTKITRDIVEYTGVSPNQMVSVATSLIPFLEHDDANRALMGSNMQRQAVPLINPERPIVGTGLEARVVSDSGHALQAETSGVVTYVSAAKICVYKIAVTNTEDLKSYRTKWQ